MNYRPFLYIIYYIYDRTVAVILLCHTPELFDDEIDYESLSEYNHSKTSFDFRGVLLNVSC